MGGDEDDDDPAADVEVLLCDDDVTPESPQHRRSLRSRQKVGQRAADQTHHIYALVNKATCRHASQLNC